MNAFAENLGVLPPQSHEAEQSVLGGLILDGSKLLELKLVADDFYSRPHRLVFTAMQTLAARRDNIDFLTVMNEMEVNGTIEDVGGHAYLGQIAKLTPSAANIKAYARIVKDNSLRRQAIAKYNEAIEAMMTTELTTNEERFEVASRLLGELEVARSSGMHKGAISSREIALKWADELEERFKRKPGEVIGFTTGFRDLDSALYPKGVLAGALVAVGARPKMGKSAFLARWVNHTTLISKKPAITFSLEMPNIQLWERMVAQESCVDSNIFWTGKDKAQLDKAYAVAGDLGNSLLYIDDTPGISLSHVVSEARRLRRKHGCLGLIAIDYLTLMKADKAERNDLAYGNITKGLKNLAKEMACPVLLLTQLNRQLEQRPDKRPQPSDSRDTGQIEQDCDLWIGLYRDAVYNENASPEEQEIAELLVRLNREGYTGTIYTRFINGRYEDVDQASVAAMYCRIEEAAKRMKEERKESKQNGRGYNKGDY